MYGDVHPIKKCVMKDNYGWGGGAFNQAGSYQLAPGIRVFLHSTGASTLYLRQLIVWQKSITLHVLL